VKAVEIKNRFLDFFEKKGHKIVSSASLIPENDPTVLFTTAGMHPLVPYLMGEVHPAGKRIANCQKCIRTGDIDEVGDETHLTFFEMLGNWSFGDYFKEDAIKWSYELLTTSLDDGGFGFKIEDLYFTVFEGDEDAPRDEIAKKLWMDCGVAENHIFYKDKSHNWWGPAGLTGPCGPDTEMFIDTGSDKCSDSCEPGCHCPKYVEIWNDVFMQYNKTPEGKFIPLEQTNVDTGAGLDRLTAIIQGYRSPYLTELFWPVWEHLAKLADLKVEIGVLPPVSARIVLDHMRAVVFMIADGIAPSNLDQGYILRRLMRRSVRHAMNLNINENFLKEIAEIFIEMYKEQYPEIKRNHTKIISEVVTEEQKFKKTLQSGTKEFEKLIGNLKKHNQERIPGRKLFNLYDTFGFPPELTEELAQKEGLEVDWDGYHKAFEKHQEVSRKGSEKKFAGGLADHTEEITKLHTATHLLHQALKDVLGDHVAQRGSNITAERLRFDFSHPEKMTKEEITKVEEIVNENINKGLPISFTEMTVEEAKAQGAIGLFEGKYGELVKVYRIGDFSCEICGGPHEGSLKDLGTFKIKKEQSSSAGIRRIKAVLKAE